MILILLLAHVGENPGHDYKWILISIYHDIKVRLGFFGGRKNIDIENQQLGKTRKWKVREKLTEREKAPPLLSFNQLPGELKLQTAGIR